MSAISSAEEIKKVREKVDAFHTELEDEDFSTEWADDIEQLEELDKLQSSLRALQEFAEDICDDIGHPLDYDGGLNATWMLVCFYHRSYFGTKVSDRTATLVSGHC